MRNLLYSSGIIFILVLLSCSGSGSPVSPGSAPDSDQHAASIANALNGVEIINTDNIEITLNGKILSPWAIHSIELEANGTYPLEIHSENPDIEVEISVDGAELMASGTTTSNFSGKISSKFELTNLSPEIQIHLSTGTSPVHTRDIMVWTTPNDNLLTGVQMGVIQYSDPEAGTFDIAERELNVGIEPGTGQDIVEALVDALDCEILRRIPKIDVYRVRIPAGPTYNQMIKNFQDSGIVRFAEVNSIKYLTLVPNDTYEDQEYENVVCQMREAWDIITGSDSTTVAIIDSGVMRDHPDLAANWIPGEDFINPPGDGEGGATPGDGQDNNNDGVIDGNVEHGTHVAGISGAIGNNAEGVSGHSWSTKILPLRVFPIDGDGGASDSSIADANIYAADNGAVASNMSLGGGFGSQTEANAINYAWDNGVVIVAAAGNSNSSGPFYPANFPNVVSVAATNSSDHKANFSNYGSLVDCSAPGVAIPSSIFYEHGGDPLSVPENQRYALYQGTSMASPQVAGLVALVKAQFPAYTNGEIVDQILFTTDDIDPLNPGYEGLLGTGRINDFRAVTTSLEADFAVLRTFDDDDNPLFSQGNRDGYLNPGETIEIYPSIKNTGLKNANDTILTVTSGNGNFSTLFDQISIGTIERGDIVVPENPILIKVSPDAADLSIANIHLNFFYDGSLEKDIEYNITIRKDLGIQETLSLSGENRFGDYLAKGSTRVPALYLELTGDLNYGTLEELTFHQSGTAGANDIGNLELWLDSNLDGSFNENFDTRIAWHSYNDSRYRGAFDDLNDPNAGFGSELDYADFPPITFDSNGDATFDQIILPVDATDVRGMFITLNVLPGAITGNTVKISVDSADDVVVKAPDVAELIAGPLTTTEVPIVGTWLDPQQLTDNGPGIGQLSSWRAQTDACPVTGNVYVVFDSNRDDDLNVYIMRSTDNGETFDDAIRLDDSTANEFYPSVTCDSNGGVHVIYYSTQIAGNNREIFYVRSTDFGASFGAPVQLTDNPGNSRVPQIVANGTDLHVAWHDDSVGNDYNIFYIKSDDAGDTWLDNVQVNNSNNDSEEVAIDVTSDGTIHLSWEEFVNNFSANTWYSRSTDGGLTFEPQVQITTGQYNNRGWHSDIAGDDNMNVYVVFHFVQFGSDAEVAYRTSNDGGASWNPPASLTDNTVADSRPSIAVLNDGSYIDIVYRSLNADTWNIFHTRSEDNFASFNEPVQISTSVGGDAREPVVVRAENLNIYAFWEDVTSGDGDYEVFWNRFLY
jgi:hypothetical protein